MNPSETPQMGNLVAGALPGSEATSAHHEPAMSS